MSTGSKVGRDLLVPRQSILTKLLDGGFSKSAIRKAFSRFSCERDPDVSLNL